MSEEQQRKESQQLDLRLVAPNTIGLGERWTQISTLLPSAFSDTSAHPDLLVEPSGFRRVVGKSLTTCNEFLDLVQKIEAGIEKRIPGISSYFSLVVAPALRKGRESTGYYGGTTVSGVILAASGIGYTGYNEYRQGGQAASSSPQQQVPYRRNAIIEKHDDIFLYGGRKLEQEEVIAFEKGLNILAKIDNLRESAARCIATFGSLDAVLEVGKVYSTRSALVYWGDKGNALQQTMEPAEMIPLSSYWSALSQAYRMRSVITEVTPLLPKDEPPKQPADTSNFNVGS